MRGLRLALLSGSGVAVLAACSQIAVLQPVAGDEITGVETAVSDVVRQSGVEVLTWPTCAFSGAVYRCEGSTVSGQPILGVTGETKPLQVKVSIGGRQIFEGGVHEVLAKEGRTP
jgi:hypothetical protein